MSKINNAYLFQIILIIIANISIIYNQEQEQPDVAYKNVNEEQEASNIMQEFANEWESKLAEYNMEYIYEIPLNKREQETYYENVTTVPTVFKGAFYIADETTDKIEFYVKDSHDQVLHKATGHYNIFEIPINKADKYSITFRNNLAKKKVVITFTMNSGQNNIINSKDLTNTEKKMDDLEAVIKKFNMEFKLSRDIHMKRYQSKL